jgi:Holliday junction DNA helicase RuvA
MIERLSGTIVQKDASRVVIDVNGVGYGVEMPLSSLCAVGGYGQSVTAWIETHVREDAIKLFGFTTVEEKELFNIVCSVSGVGPRIGLAILGTLQPAQIFAAVIDGRKEMLESVPGIGKRLAERLAVELKPKIEKHLKSRPAALAAARSGATGSPRQPGPLDIFAGAGPAEDPSSQLFGDAQSALENLGFKDKDVTQALGKVWKDQNGAVSFTGKDGLTGLIRGALAELTGVKE